MNATRRLFLKKVSGFMALSLLGCNSKTNEKGIQKRNEEDFRN